MHVCVYSVVAERYFMNAYTGGLKKRLQTDMAYQAYDKNKRSHRNNEVANAVESA